MPPYNELSTDQLASMTPEQKASSLAIYVRTLIHPWDDDTREQFLEELNICLKCGSLDPNWCCYDSPPENYG